MPITIKRVKGIEYVYFTYYDQKTGKKKEIYCGVAIKSESKKKALKLEISHLTQQKEDIVERVKEVENELKQLS